MYCLALIIYRLRKFAFVFEIISNTAVDKMFWSGKSYMNNYLV